MFAFSKWYGCGAIVIPSMNSIFAKFGYSRSTQAIQIFQAIWFCDDKERIQQFFDFMCTKKLKL